MVRRLRPIKGLSQSSDSRMASLIPKSQVACGVFVGNTKDWAFLDIRVRQTVCLSCGKGLDVLQMLGFVEQDNVMQIGRLDVGPWTNVPWFARQFGRF